MKFNLAAKIFCIENSYQTLIYDSLREKRRKTKKVEKKVTFSELHLPHKNAKLLLKISHSVEVSSGIQYDLTLNILVKTISPKGPFSKRFKANFE